MESRLSGNYIFFLFIVLLVSFVTAYIVTNWDAIISIAIVVTISIFVISFLDVKVSLYILIFSMLLSPEIMMSGLGGKEVAGRGVTFRLEDFLLVVIGLSWFTKAAFFKELGLFGKTALNRPILAYVVICFTTTMIGTVEGRVVFKTGFFFVLKYIEYYIIFFLLINNIKGKREIKHFMTAIFITCAIVSFLGILQISSGKRVIAPFEGEMNSEPNTLGGYLVLMLSFSSSMWLSIKSKERIWLLGLCVLIVPPLLFTLSRSSWLSLVPMFIVLFILANKKLLLTKVVIAFFFLGFLFMPESVVNRFKYTFTEQKGFARSEKIAGVEFDPSTSERINRFKSSLNRFTEYPVLGRGITGAGFIDGQYNRILEEAGLLGLFSFFWIIAVIFKQSYLLFKTTDDDYFKGLALGMISGLFAILVHAIGGNSFIIVRIMEPFWFLTGIIITVINLEKSPKVIKQKTKPFAILSNL